MVDKITTIKELEKAIGELTKQYVKDGVDKDISNYWVLKSDVLEKIGELELFLTKNLGKTDGDWAFLGLTVNEVARLVRQETIKEILGGKSG